MDKYTDEVLRFASVNGRKVEATFDGGLLTSDGGVFHLREVELKVRVIDRIVAALRDSRHQSYVDHSYRDLIRQRVFQIGCGYEDADDCDFLRKDPAMKMACERLPVSGLPLASQPTMSRFENAVSPKELYRIGQSFVDTFITSYEAPPKQIVLDIDDTEDTTYGCQQLRLFNGYYDDFIYLPLHIYEGQSGKLITTILRTGRRPTGLEIVAILKRVVSHIRRAWPSVGILVRGDGHFSAPEVHKFCDKKRLHFILGQGGNSRLDALSAETLENAQNRYNLSGEQVLSFTQFYYQAKGWAKPLRIVCKVEVSKLGINVRYIVTSFESSQPSFLYQHAYCDRGRMENFIKNHKTYLHSDRTSCHRFEANQLRLFLFSAAYVLLHALNATALKGTNFVHEQFNTIQLHLIKVAARIEELSTKVRIHYATAFPFQETYCAAIANLARTVP